MIIFQKNSRFKDPHKLQQENHQDVQLESPQDGKFVVVFDRQRSTFKVFHNLLKLLTNYSNFSFIHFFYICIVTIQSISKKKTHTKTDGTSYLPPFPKAFPKTYSPPFPKPNTASNKIAYWISNSQTYRISNSQTYNSSNNSSNTSSNTSLEFEFSFWTNYTPCGGSKDFLLFHSIRKRFHNSIHS
jgi:hypothetical protein